ncbi:Nitrilase [uncultured archaeon]|nr:Nitrilase [uncultured archaeon]
MKVGFVQLDSRLLDVNFNVKHALELMEESKVKADLWVLPELFNTGYNFQNKAEVEAVAELVPNGATTIALIAFSRKHKCAIVAGVAESDGGKIYNSAVVVEDGVYRGVYRKVHLFNREKLFFSAGKEFKVFRLKGVQVGVMVCFDWYFPESARTLALKGAEVIAHPSNLVLPNCPDSMPVRARENRVYTVTADRVGEEHGLKYIGLSEIVAPDGKILVRASADKEEVGVAEIDPSKARDKRLNEYNDLIADRKPESYKLN